MRAKEKEKRLRTLVRRAAKNNGKGYLLLLSACEAQATDMWYWKGVLDALTLSISDLQKCSSEVLHGK